MTDLSAQSPSFLSDAVFDRVPAFVAAGALALGVIAVSALVDLRQGALFIIGGGLGAALYHGSFGFTGGWRRMLVEKRGRAMRAQMTMIAAAALGIIPLMAAGNLGGQALVGAVAPVGVSVLVGAAIFGLGMQLGGACGSGTLFSVGGGSARMLITLVFFIAGALVGTAHLPWWLTLPSIPAIGLGSRFGVGAALLITFVGLGLVALITAAIEWRTHGGLESDPGPGRRGWSWIVYGPWPLLGAGFVLAILNIATVLVSGHPWSITYGFGLWGAKIAQAIGVPVANWAFWSLPAQASALKAPVLADGTSVMNFGIILGAGLAAALAGKFAPKASLPIASIAAAVIGGFLMGYGARLSFGCNIGALFSGIASGSLHAWLWFAAAFAGSALGVTLRPFFGLDGFRKR